MGVLRRWQDIKKGFIVKKILELNFEELVRVKPADGGGGQLRSEKTA